MTHEHDTKRMEHTAETWCDDARGNRVHDHAYAIWQDLREAHGRKADLTKMAIRIILRGNNMQLSWSKCEAALTRLVDAAMKLGGL